MWIDLKSKVLKLWAEIGFSGLVAWAEWRLVPADPPKQEVTYPSPALRTAELRAVLAAAQLKSSPSP